MEKSDICNFGKGLYFSVLIFWFVIMLVGVVLGIYFKNSITDILNINLLTTFITGYFFYSMIATIQMLLSLLLDTNKSFIIIVAMVILSALVTNHFIKYIFVIPIGMGLNKAGLTIGIIRTILVIIIII